MNRANFRQSALRLASVLVGLPVLILIFGIRHGVLHRGNRLGAVLQFTVAGMAMSGFLLAVLTLRGTPATAVLRVAPLVLLGDLSHCLYVSHLMVLDLIDFILRRFMDLDAATLHLSFLAVRATIALPIMFGLAMISRR